MISNTQQSFKRVNPYPYPNLKFPGEIRISNPNLNICILRIRISKPNLRNDPHLAQSESKDSICGILYLPRIELGITKKGRKFAHLCSTKFSQTETRNQRAEKN